jgi:hypothetical protein
MRFDAVFPNLSIILMFFVAFLLEAFDGPLYYLSVQEDEPLEWATFWGFAIAGVVYFTHASRQMKSTRQFPWFVFGLALFCFLVAMEEISWGQRILGYRAPDFFLAENYQQELNIHNVVDTSARKFVMQLILLGYGVVLSALSLWSPAQEQMQRFRVVAPPSILIAGFLTMFVFYVWYPWSHTGEWVEAAMALGFVYAATIDAQLDRSTDASLLTKKLVTVFVMVWVLALITVFTLRLLQPEDSERIQRAQAEITALQADLNNGNLPARCGIHKRLYTFMLDYEQPYLLEGGFARLLDDSGEVSRADFLLDPWNSAYWIRLKCVGNRKATFVYSFGPNRRRDSTEWMLKPDDIGADLLVAP